MDISITDLEKYNLDEEQRPIVEILKRKVSGIDCTEEESAEVKGYIKSRLIGIHTGDVEIEMLIQSHFPQEYGEAIDERESNSKQ